MFANYHTHTYRCHHGYGCEWEYAENAIAGGLKLLGFADHAPWRFPAEHRSRMRMAPEDLAGYVATIEQLKKRYAGRLQILCGLEAEYYPELFDDFLAMLQEAGGIDYLILGQHYLYNEYDQPLHTSKPSEDEGRLIRYVDQVTEGLATGRYLYLCHPDVLNFTGDPAFYKEQMRRLCRNVNELGYAMELNLQGYRSGFSYPCRRFWEIAAEENCTAIIGTDAHRAKYVCDGSEIAHMQALAKELGLKLIDSLEEVFEK